MTEVTIHHGDSRDVLKTLADCSIDSVVCDPPDESGAGEDSRPPGMSLEAWAEYWRGMTPEQRLARARERWGG